MPPYAWPPSHARTAILSRVRARACPQVVVESPTAFLHKLDNEEEDFSKPMKFVSDRLRSLLRTLEVSDARGLPPPMPHAHRPCRMRTARAACACCTLHVHTLSRAHAHGCR